MTEYCSVADVVDLTGVKAKHYYPKDDNAENKFNTLIRGWITSASAIVDKYTNDTFNSPVPENVRLATCLITSNIIAFGQSRKETPLIKNDDWNVTVSNVNLLDDNIKALLAPFKKEAASYKSDSVDFFVISGD